MGDIRFECRFCNKPVTVDPKFAGQRMKCPSCKNPVVVPGTAGGLAQSYDEAGGQQQLQKVSDKTVRKGGFGLGGLVRLVVAGAVLYGLYVGYGWFQGQAKKPLRTLFKEMNDQADLPTHPNEAVIRKKVMDARKDGKLPDSIVRQLSGFKKSSSVRARTIVVEELGGSKNKKAIEPLFTVLRTDKSDSLRSSAAGALGKLGKALENTSVIGKLITEMEKAQKKKKNDLVSDIHTAVRDMTGHRDINTPKPRLWREWWDKVGGSWKYGDK